MKLLIVLKWVFILILVILKKNLNIDEGNYKIHIGINSENFVKEVCNNR